MVWFRQAASYYQSQCWQIYVAILRHNVLSNTINGDPALPTRLRGKTTGDRWFSQKISHAEFCVRFVFSLSYWLGKQWSCPWLKTLWRQCHFTVLTVFTGHCCLYVFDLIRQIIIWTAQQWRIIGASFQHQIDIANLISFPDKICQLILQMKHLIDKRNL